jgi:release factor glutamine methyltransferase
VETPRLDAELLLAEAMERDRAYLAAHPEAEVPAASARLFGEMVRRRLRREPVAYILGRRGFRSIELGVDSRALIPRPETELLVELALELQPRRVLDVGTGSGAIALAVAEEMSDCEVTASDTSPGALDVARANAARLGLTDRVEFVEGSVVDGRFDLVLANLPYIAEPDWAALQPEVTEWEPREALLAGPDGLGAIRGVLAECGRLIGPGEGGVADGGVVLGFEVGEGQAEAVGAMMREMGLGSVQTRADLAGIARVVIGRGGDE